MKNLIAIAAAVLILGCDSKPPTTSTNTNTTPPADPPKNDPPKTETGKNDPKAAPDPDIVITGRISYSGTAAKRLKEKGIEADQACAAHYNEKEPLLKDDLIVGKDGGIKNVVVWVKSGLEGRTFDMPKKTVTLGQKGCRYEPHVIAITAGSDVKVINDDSMKHNVHLLPEKNRATPDNLTQNPGDEKSWSFPTSEEPFKIKCDIHAWMGAWCLVSAHPYFAVTGEDGAYELKGLPPGEYVVAAWHETLGTQTKTVKVGAKEKAKADFSMEKK